MKILFLEQYAEAGGAQRCLLDLLPGVRAAGWEAHVALPEDGPLVPLLQERGAQVHFLSLGRYPSGRKSLATASGSSRICRRWRAKFARWRTGSRRR